MNILTDPSFDKACNDRVSYGFFTRQGGVSEGIYSGLNCAYLSKDDGENVARNRALVAGRFGIEPGNLSTLSQCHSADCFRINAPLDGAGPSGDALVTSTPGQLIAVLTADCGPVLFTGCSDTGAPIIGAAHAGWGGALKGVLESTLEKMVEEGAMLNTITACLGPCLMQSSFEVKEDFIRPFIIQHEEAEKFFMETRKSGSYMFDLPGYIAMRLSLAGVRRVSLMGLNTYTDEERFFSYRRATHRAEPDYGRQISAIVINP
jgi:YfiH family protein